jgi:hypothetical protein
LDQVFLGIFTKFSFQLTMENLEFVWFYGFFYNQFSSNLIKSFTIIAVHATPSNLQVPSSNPTTKKNKIPCFHPSCRLWIFNFQIDDGNKENWSVSESMKFNQTMNEISSKPENIFFSKNFLWKMDL